MSARGFLPAPLCSDPRLLETPQPAARIPTAEAKGSVDPCSLAAAPPVRGGACIGVCAGLELYPKGRATQLEHVQEEMFQIAAVGRRDVRQRGAVDDDQRRIHPSLVRVAQFGPRHAGPRRLLLL